MDILGTVKSLLGGSEGGEQNELIKSITNLVGGQGGGLNNLVQQFSSKGLGDVISSWISTGKNLPVSADQIQNVLGSDTIKGIASKVGLDTGTVSKQLSDLLPNLVDKLTPDGKIPEGDLISEGMDKLGNLFGKK
jgi:uncharacterized protein YidB (DUF937 family)